VTPLPPPPPPPANSSPWLWALLGCGLLAFLFGAIAVTGGVVYLVWLGHTQANRPALSIEATPGSVAPAAPLKPLPDADVLAQRMKWDQDVYQKLRDEALAGYAQLHPKPAPYDDEAHAALKLLAYLCTWGDYYGESLWEQYDTHVTHLFDQGAKFTVFSLMRDVYIFQDRHSSNEESAMGCTRDAIDFQTTHYPAYFKLAIYKVELDNLIECRNCGAIQMGPGTAFDKVPALVDLATQTYGELLREHLPNTLLFRAGSNLLSAVSKDESTLNAVTAGLDRAFDANDKGDPLADVLKGDFYVEDAWCARGGGWASSVSQKGWDQFGQRLVKANDILTAVYAAHPDQTGTPRVMMTVVLGQQLARDQMELWFQRGLKLNPDPYPLYMAKRWYLLPRWYGSDEDEWAFGLECSKSDDWDRKVPAMLLECVTDAAERDPGLYAKPEMWTPIERVFRDYLDHFPNAFYFRSRFVKCAAQGGHWDVAAEQLKLLGNDWDRSVFEGNEYAKIHHLVAAHTSQ